MYLKRVITHLKPCPIIYLKTKTGNIISYQNTNIKEIIKNLNVSLLLTTKQN